MNKDIKAISETYNLGINHTERNNDAYQFKAKDYSVQRAENEEEKDYITKRRIAFELNNMTKRASRGLKEDYTYILTNLNKLKEDIAKLITGS